MSHPSGRVADKVIVVTGAGSGIGRATAELRAREGARVAVTDICESAASEVVRGIVSAGHDAVVLGLDVASEPNWEAAMNSILN